MFEPPILTGTMPCVRSRTRSWLPAIWVRGRLVAAEKSKVRVIGPWRWIYCPPFEQVCRETAGVSREPVFSEDTARHARRRSRTPRSQVLTEAAGQEAAKGAVRRVRVVFSFSRLDADGNNTQYLSLRKDDLEQLKKVLGQLTPKSP